MLENRFSHNIRFKGDLPIVDKGVNTLALVGLVLEVDNHFLDSKMVMVCNGNKEVEECWYVSLPKFYTPFFSLVALSNCKKVLNGKYGFVEFSNRFLVFFTSCQKFTKISFMFYFVFCFLTLEKFRLWKSWFLYLKSKLWTVVSYLRKKLYQYNAKARITSKRIIGLDCTLAHFLGAKNERTSSLTRHFWTTVLP